MPKIRSRFLFNHRTKHPSIVFDDLGTKYGYISITHSKYYKKSKNLPLKVNPEQGNTTQAYILPKPYTDKKKAFSPMKKKMRIDPKDRYKINKVKKRPY